MQVARLVGYCDDKVKRCTGCACASPLFYFGASCYFEMSIASDVVEEQKSRCTNEIYSGCSYARWNPETGNQDSTPACSSTSILLSLATRSQESGFSPKSFDPSFLYTYFWDHWRFQFDTLPAPISYVRHTRKFLHYMLLRWVKACFWVWYTTYRSRYCIRKIIVTAETSIGCPSGPE